VVKTSVLKDGLHTGAIEHYRDALYYDHTYRHRTADVEYYRQFVRQHGGPVLELGGGSGRIALALVKDGADVTVLDASASMLARAEAKAKVELNARDRKRLRLVHGDMRGFSLPGKFASILAPFNTLLHLYDPADFAACFAAVARHLSAQGLFVCDVSVPDLTELLRKPDRIYRIRPFVHPTLRCKVRYEEQFRYDPVSQVQHVTIRFIPERGGAGTKKAARPAKPQEILLSQRQIFPAELRALLALGGLELQARHGDFTGRPFGQDDGVQIVTARAKAKTARK
jgi:SAM-dependent methyltransferase